jgi:hypothetical protein
MSDSKPFHDLNPGTETYLINKHQTERNQRYKVPRTQVYQNNINTKTALR